MASPAVLPTVISYAHGPYDAQVLELAHRLIGDGVPCEVDLWDPRPAGGWSRWMTQKMTGTDVVLVVCTEMYFRRYNLEGAQGVGTGATFEGGMLNRRVLDAQGSQHGVIPVVFDRADFPWIPQFLLDETRFVLFEQYDDLYRVLTNQPAFVRPPLGPVRIMPPIAVAAPLVDQQGPAQGRGPDLAPSDTILPVTPLVVFRLEDGSALFANYSELVRENGTVNIDLLVRDAADQADIPRLRGVDSVTMAWGLVATRGRITQYRESRRTVEHIVQLRLVEDNRPLSFGAEPTYNGITPDQMARRRARRILLDERAADTSELGSFSTQRLNDEMLEHYVSGAATGVGVTGSPIPLIIRKATDQIAAVEAARLLCIALLHVTHTVERVRRLDLTPVAGGIQVDFEGVRARVYSNVEPSTIAVSGVCPV